MDRRFPITDNQYPPHPYGCVPFGDVRVFLIDHRRFIHQPQMINSDQILAVTVRTHFACHGQSVSELAYNGSDTSGLENPRGWMGQASRFAPLLSACTRKALGGPIQTIPPAFDGLKVFPSLAGLSIARFGRSLVQACQPASVSAHRVSALAPQSGGLRGLIDAEMSKYLSNTARQKSRSTDNFFELSQRRGRAIRPAARQMQLISKPTDQRTRNSAKSVRSHESQPSATPT